ncbi:FKBP-type peptidyl-prolyl cis-trans isomerase [Daejeonella sp.]|uniref:FKBP-type peptidyl-prolyl cis-trans isomerase n=1 Tax=Daejeonella sp. TaxID=2805397 RepID=UPI00271D75FB|nr:FKBP-type peptidyl-prolyl cis-trans isomerase [Daejeonella sp.]MDO8992508.1 FKBP-type peptidyl-prolyl cis-trans isomerase [Daejeonella sp.]MDP2413451.1 FKBP-type peptidyl-prolyl cis-trans isomerase [Daejeonella sp.]
MKNSSKSSSVLKYLLVVSIFLYSVSASAQKSPVRTSTPVVKLNSPADSLQYTLGAYLGQWITNNGFMVTNPELFKKGMDDVLLNRPLLINAASVASKLDGYQQRLISQRSSQQERLLFENIKGKEGVGMLPSGVAYVVMKAGNGIRPQLNDSVMIHLKGFLPDGSQFEDTYAKKAALRSTPAGLIPGMSEALQIMPLGSTWRLIVPSALAYAERGVPGLIPAYSALIFEVELIDVMRR